MWGMKSRGRSLFARACGLLQASQGHVEGLPPASLSQRQYHQSIERRDLSFSRGSAGGAGEDEGAQAKTEAGAAAATSADEEMVKSVVPVPGGEGADERETWGGKVDFLLSVIGFAVDLANVWRFPYLCYKNGGGAFLIPYGVMLIVGGIPLFYMELALGQFHRRGAITCWGRLVPLLKGIGYSVVLIAFYVDFYYNVIIAWSLRYFVSSFTSVLPWTSCDNSWNTPLCEPFALSITGEGNSTNTTEFPKGTKFTSAAAEYFTRNVLELHMSKGLDDAGKIKWDLALCLLAVYLICYFSLWKGVSTSGKVVWFTALFPYCVLLCLFIRGVTLPGSAEGIRYYLNPNFDVIAKAEVWVDAATQVFYSLGPGFGVLLAYASYNEFHNNVYQDALVTSVINSLTSFIAGFVIFSVLGYMSYASGRSIEDVATEGPGLVFMVYPAAIATMPGSVFWSLMFFMMLLTLGLDSSFGGSEAIITALSDEFPVISRHREIFVALLFIIYYLVGLWSCAQGGFYFFQLLDKFAAGYSILIAVFFESIAISWIYGTDRFCEDLKNMIGFYPGIYWRLCWRYVAPIFLIFITVYGLSVYTPLTYEDYVYPEWANAFGWCIAGSSVAMIPIVAIYKLITTPGTFMERMKILTTPWCDPHPIPANGNAGTPGDGSTGTPGGKAGGTGAPSPVDASDPSSPTSPSKTKPKPAEKATSPHQPAPKSTVVSVAPTGHPATAKTVTSPVSPIGERSSSQEMYREPPKDVKRRVSNTPTGPEAV